jgi:hypothetical protein
MSRVINKPRVIDLSSENNGQGDAYNVGHSIANTANTLGSLAGTAGSLGAALPFISAPLSVIGAGLGVFGNLVGGLTEAFHQPKEAPKPVQYSAAQVAAQQAAAARPGVSFTSADRAFSAKHDNEPLKLNGAQNSSLQDALAHTGGFNIAGAAAAKAQDESAKLPMATTAAAPAPQVMATANYDRPAEYAHPTFMPSQSFQSTNRSMKAEPAAKKVGKKIKPDKKKVVKLKKK